MSLPAADAPVPGRGFGSTCWVTVRAAAANDAVARAAREELCKDYWYPLYAYLRRMGHDNDAEDITQDFLAYILQRSWLSRADETQGKFRSFLLSSLDNFVRDLVAHQNAKKRAGGYRHIPLDMDTAASRYSQSKAASVPVTVVYETEWASAMVAAALRRLEEEYAAAGKQHQHQLLKVYLQEMGNAVGYQMVADALQTSVDNVQVCVHRLRQRYGALLREEVSRTVGTPQEVDGEVRYLREVLSVTRVA